MDEPPKKKRKGKRPKPHGRPRVEWEGRPPDKRWAKLDPSDERRKRYDEWVAQQAKPPDVPPPPPEPVVTQPAPTRLVAWAPQEGPQEAFITCEVEDVCFGGSRGGGKGLLARSGMVLTPFGFKSVRDVKVGDKVCAVDGTVTHVIGVWTRGLQPAYRCHFSDGSSIEVDGDHIWQGWRVNQTVKKGNVRTSGENATQNYSMQELLRFVGVERDRAAPATNRLAIPVPEAVAYNVTGQFCGPGNFVSRAGLHPYVLGVLLGDGCVTNEKNVLFCCADDEMAERVRGLLGEGDALRGPYPAAKGSASTWRIYSPAAKATLAAFGVAGKYAHEKAIPRIYKMGSVEERWELLRGLMDTDGWAEADGDIYFTSTSEALAKDTRELAWSLGGTVTWRERIPTFTHLGSKKEGRRAYALRMKFRDNSMAFSLSRKKNVARSEKQRFFARHMEAIEPIGEEESICIAVAHRSSLFIANDFLVTHNSDALLGDALIRANKYGKHFRGLLLRRSLPELDEIEKRSEDLYPLIGATFAVQAKEWTFPQGGTLRLRYLADDSDAEQYQGHSYTWIGPDEIGNFPDPKPLDKLRATLRSAHGVPCVMRSTCNPGGPGHSWVFERYVQHQPYVIRRWRPQPKLAPNSWSESVFIPSRLEDNKILMRNDPTYENKIVASSGGDADLYRAWRFGDWNILAGGYFQHSWDPATMVYEPNSVKLPGWYQRRIGIDWGFAHDTVAYWAATDGISIYIYREMVCRETTPTALAARLIDESMDETIGEIYMSPDAFNRRSDQRTIATEMDEVLNRRGYPALQPAKNDRVNGWQYMSDMMRRGLLKISRNCFRLIKAIPQAQRDPDRPEDVLKTRDVLDDCRDSARYTLHSAPREVHEPIELKIMREVNPASEETFQYLQYMKALNKYSKGEAPITIARGRR